MSTASALFSAASLRRFVLVALVLGACARESERQTDLMDLDAPVLAAELASGRITAEEVTLAALDRIASLDDSGPMLNAIIEVNPDALTIARELDARLRESGPVGPLHGLPVAIKANIDTADSMATSAGSLALADHHADADAALVAQLRAAGAIIVAKTNLSEWANFRGRHSSSGWSSLGGQTKNPYVLDRSPCGSSSGSAVAVAARIVPLAVGTETDGSIVCPAAVNGVVGIKPTHGSVSAQGIIPVAASQDVAGPFARTVRGAALLLAAMRTPASPALTTFSHGDRADLTGVRIGVLRDYAGAGSMAAVSARYEEWLDLLERVGAELVDPVDPAVSSIALDTEFEILLYEFSAGIDEYLADIEAPVASLSDLIEYNRQNAATVMPHFGQELFEMAQVRDDLSDAVYRDALAQARAMRASLRALFFEQKIDALVAPVTGPAWKTDWGSGDRLALSSSSLAAVSGFPSIAVPGGMTQGLPLSIAFIGPPDSEDELIDIASIFERSRGRVPEPQFFATIDEQTDQGDNRGDNK